ncbi:MAG: peptidase [Xanthomonadales bacterium]|nr:peptidase [Xanthomonadales bacterium]
MTADRAFHGISARLVAGALLVGAAPFVHGATIVIQNANAAGVGFNDGSAPQAGAGCNAGETLGQCRLRVFNQAAAQWGTLLVSNVTITVSAQMIAQTCDASGAVLGSAGPTSAHSNFANAPRTGVAYVQALANSYAGTDLGASADLNANFNILIDSGCSAGTVGWWYGTDPAVTVPDDRIPLLPVVFHEIGHGLGFTALYNTATGAASTGANPPIWGFYLYDTETDKLWKDMTNAERVASAINDPDLVWAGPLTSSWSSAYLGSAAKAIVNTPPGIAGIYEAQTGEFGPSVINARTGDVVLVNDGSGTPSDGCETPFANAAAVAGKIALIDRGICAFTVKVKNAQLNGAIGVLVGNNTAGLPPMGGNDATITIPSLGITQALATSIKANLPGTNVTLGTDPGGALSGTTDGCVRMFGPNPLQSGSSVSHFHSDALPNLLMEPALNRSIFNRIDLTLPLFRDIGWRMNPENILFRESFDANPCQHVQP